MAGMAILRLLTHPGEHEKGNGFLQEFQCCTTLTRQMVLSTLLSFPILKRSLSTLAHKFLIPTQLLHS